MKDLDRFVTTIWQRSMRGGELAAAWHSNKFLSPVTDGAVLPIRRQRRPTHRLLVL